MPAIKTLNYGSFYQLCFTPQDTHIELSVTRDLEMKHLTITKQNITLLISLVTFNTKCVLILSPNILQTLHRLTTYIAMSIMCLLSSVVRVSAF